MKKNYHSALQKERYYKDNINNFEKNGNKCFTLDCVNDFNKIKDIKDFDLIYSEPAWKQGYLNFLKRANNDQSNYDSYISSMTNMISIINKPIVLILGKHIIKKMPSPQSILEINLHNYKTNVLSWHIDLNKYKNKFKTNYDLINLLAKDYECVWDFNCGYGNTGKIFLENGKKCLLSDINPKCITFIAENIIC